VGWGFMVRAILMVLGAAGMAAAARFSVWPARSYREWWVALFATELGYVWVWIALGLAGWAAWVARGGGTVGARVVAGVAAVLALAAVAGFARPTWLAWRMSGQVETDLNATFGPGERVWSWARLAIWPTAVEAIEAEGFSAEGRAVDFYRARGTAAGERAPCVVLVHGGGWNSGDRSELAGFNRWLAARGVAVVAFDYRLAPASRWPAQREDLRVVVGWIRANAERLGVDAERLTLVGRSAGGQIAAATAYGEVLPGVRAVVALYACHDLEYVWSLRSSKDALNSEKLMMDYLGGGPEGREELYRSGSAEKLVHPGAPKTLLIHGALDELVWCRHSERLTAALERAGVPHVFVRMPWATHAGDANLHGPAGQLITGAVLRVARQAGRLATPDDPQVKGKD